jgi:hypothetical protein
MGTRAAISVKGRSEMSMPTSAYGDDPQNGLGQNHDAVEGAGCEDHEEGQRQEAFPGSIVEIGKAAGAGEELEEWKKSGFEEKWTAEQRAA